MNKQYIDVNPYTRPGYIRSFTRNVVWHYTANPGASAEAHFIYFGKTLPAMNRQLDIEALSIADSADRVAHLKKRIYSSANVFIDREQTLIIIPLDEQSHHASQANPYSIGVELCLEKDGSFHPETIRQAIAFGVFAAKEYNLNPLSDFLRHYDVTGKICPKQWVEKPAEWESFKTSVDNKIKGKGGNRIMELQDWQWTMLGDAIKELSQTGGGITGNTPLLSYEWAEKAYNRSLTIDEITFINTVSLARSQRRDVNLR